MRPLSLTALLLAVPILAGCQRSDRTEGVTVEDVKRDLKKAIDTGEKYISQTRDEVQRRLEGELRRLDVDIDAWRAKLERATEEQRPAIEQHVRSLEDRRQQLGKDTAELRDATAETWREQSNRVQRSLDDLRTSAQRKVDEVK